VTDILRTDLDDGVLRLTLNRPDKRNALSLALMDAMHEAIERADLDAHVRVVTIAGAGKDFCAGADLDELLASAGQPPEVNARDAMRLGDLFLAMRRLPKPVVAIVQGRALAGGCGLATACDLVLAHADAQFGYPEVQRGFVPAMVMALLRRTAGEKRAFDLVTTGRVVSADEAAALGLISRVFSAGGFAADVATIVRGLASASPTALALTKQLFYALDDMPLAEGIRLGADVNALARSTPDFAAIIASFLKR
jgi:methylglutaconyl-CoA hydratase